MYWIITIIINGKIYTELNLWGSAMAGHIIKDIIPVIGPAIDFISSLSDTIFFISTGSSFNDGTATMSILKNCLISVGILIAFEIATIVFIYTKFKEKKEKKPSMLYACPKCGLQVSVNDLFCAGCGCNLKEIPAIKLK